MLKYNTDSENHFDWFVSKRPEIVSTVSVGTWHSDPFPFQGVVVQIWTTGTFLRMHRYFCTALSSWHQKYKWCQYVWLTTKININKNISPILMQDLLIRLQFLWTVPTHSFLGATSLGRTLWTVVTHALLVVLERTNKSALSSSDESAFHQEFRISSLSVTLLILPS